MSGQFRDKIRNAQIGINLGEHGTGIIEWKGLRRFEHLVRMGEDRKPKQISEARVKGKRRSGKLGIDQEDYNGQIMERKGKSLQEMRRMAKDRDKFR